MHRFIQRLSVMFILLLPIFTYAQEWVARYNGPGNDDDFAYDIVVDNIGNVYVTGASRVSSTEDMDYATVKYDSSGVEQWVMRYNGPNNSEDEAVAIAVDNSGNVCVTGFSEDSTSYPVYATIRYFASGAEHWVAWYGSGWANDIATDNFGNIYVTGGSAGDYATVKYNTSGVEQWVALYEGHTGMPDGASSIAVDNAGNVYVTGTSWGDDSLYWPFTAFDYATVKYNASGVEQWAARYDGPDDMGDRAVAIAVDNAGNVYVTGASHDADTVPDYATVKYDSSGVEQWTARYDGPDNMSDSAVAIAVDSIGNVYVTGRSMDNDTDMDFATVKYDAFGVEQWAVRYHGGVHHDWATSIAVDNVGNVYVTGACWTSNTGVDYATIKYDAMGIEQWVMKYDGPSSMADGATSVTVDNAGNVYVTGSSGGIGTVWDYATIKYSATAVEENRLIVREQDDMITTIFRGPLQLPEGKKCKVYDITGRVVEPDKIQPGIYFIEVDGVVTQKVVRVK